MLCRVWVQLAEFLFAGFLQPSPRSFERDQRSEEEEEGFYILASQQGCVDVLGKVP